MIYQLIISTPIGAEIIYDLVCEGCEVVIGEVKTHVDLLKLGELESDVILRMDWLSICHADVDCNQKRVILKMEGLPESIYEGTMDKQSVLIISAFKATKLLR